MNIIQCFGVVLLVAGALTSAHALNLEIEAKATVFLDQISTSENQKGPFGLALPNKEIADIRAYLNLKNTEILNEKQFIARFKSSNQRELAYCFAIKIVELNETHATVIGENNPLGGFVESQLYHLKRERGRWIIESKEIYKIS